jgi:hypothetical protein
MQMGIAPSQGYERERDEERSENLLDKIAHHAMQMIPIGTSHTILAF